MRKPHGFRPPHRLPDVYFLCRHALLQPFAVQYFPDFARQHGSVFEKRGDNNAFTPMFQETLMFRVSL